MPVRTTCAICGIELDGEFICPVCRYRKPEETADPTVDFAAAPGLTSPALSDSEAAAFIAKRFLPELWIGYGIAVFLAISEFFLPEAPTTLSQSPTAEPGPLGVAFLIGVFFWAYCVYKLHDLPNAVLNGKYPISAGRAAGYHFIPIYGLYWVFRWTDLYAEFLNAQTRRRLLSGGWLGLWLLAGFLLRPLDGAIALLVLFGGLSYLSHKIRKAAPEL